ncbi:Protein of unknown function (DUF3078) [Chitinophaga skermanii]|uniref:DUF3078 family protein n=1 Tax=Chitinophaga skermanii TaxID=331697 RepID=A0A327QHA7_9BACT|nr:DUF3078 domain-containing protein [Chitinophaga skermanii]RAJ03996.1 Protein of unknown function (DUF3078) [Chitinophaga skermanii]
MKKICLLLASFLFSVMLVHAQDQTFKKYREEVAGKLKTNDKDTTNRLWKKGGTFSLTVNQGSLTNWAAGGDKFSLSIASAFTGFYNYKEGRRRWDNTLDLAFGYVNTTSLGSRKSDDRIDFTSKYGYEIAKSLYVSGLVNLRTQFANGYLYTDTSKTFVSRFFSPAYVIASPGLDYIPNNELSIFVSPITARWVIVMDDSLSRVGSYGVDSGKHVQTEYGAYLTATWNKKITSNIVYKTRLDLFSNYKHNPKNIDLFWTNIITMKINKYLSANVSLDMIYDDDIKVFENKETGVLGPRLQVKQVIGVGLTAVF